MSDLQSALVQEQRGYERAFCACVFGGAEDLAIARCGWLDGSMFVDEKLGKFWDCVKAGAKPIDCAVDSGVYADIVDAMSGVPTVLFPDDYAKSIARVIHLRDATHRAVDVVKAVTERDVGGLRAAVDALKELPGVRGEKQDVVYTADIHAELREMVESNNQSIMTGISALDSVLRGLSKKDLSVLAGRPGMGKTSIAVEIARRIAEQKRYRVLMFSVEMPRLQVWGRMACGDAGVAWQDLRSGLLSEDKIEEVMDISSVLSASLIDHLFIDDQTWDVPTMIEKSSVYKPDIVIVDHLGEIKWHERGLEELVWYGRATKMLRTEIARRMNTHVMLIHQLNRSVESRQDKRPMLSDLRASGEIEQIADLVLMLYRDDYYADADSKPLSQEVPMEIWIRKNRQGAMNSVAHVGFNMANQRFFELADINDMLHAIAKS